MKKVLVLGSGGMLGNALFKYLNKNDKIDVYGTVRKNNYIDSKILFFDFYISKIDTDLNLILDKIEPNYVINCIGFIRPNQDIQDYEKSIHINSYLPHILSFYSNKKNFSLINISTDCVFDGKNGLYDEKSMPNEKNIYGISKFLGESLFGNSVTVRTSIIGIEERTERNLLNWFLNPKNKYIEGYSNVFWNGITTLTFAKICERIILENIKFDKKLIQVTSPNIVSKYELLEIFNECFGLNKKIIKNEDIVSNKTLISSPEQEVYFKEIIKPIKQQIIELKEFYENTIFCRQI